MVPIRPSLVYLSAALVGTAFLMLSCASKTEPDHLTVHAPSHFAGIVHVDTCVNGAPAADIAVDQNGAGKTSLCPAVDHQVEIEVIEDQQHFKLVAHDVRVRRTGDGIATSVEAQFHR